MNPARTNQPPTANSIRRRRTALQAWTALALVAVASGWLPSVPVAQADEFPEPVPELAYALDTTSGLLAASHGGQFLGTRSCAATACHGSVQADTRFALSLRNEYTSWLDHDPHARAQFTLSNSESQEILRRLRRAGEPPEEEARRLANCLACHNPQPPATRQATTFYSYDGVSCELCHGAAEKWIGAHVASGWADQKASDRPAWRGRAGELGFVDTEDLTIRGQMCAQCHVGSPGREVNHDLIAAGHPVLKFELAAYHDRLPKHWRAAAERQADPRFEVKLWSAGQMAAADAALALLDWRADLDITKHPDAAWPELAEFDCFACHHDLEAPSWRRELAAATGPPVELPAWGTWSFAPIRLIHDTAGQPGQSLAMLTQRMQQGFGRDPAGVQAAVATARTQLESWRQAQDPDGLAVLMRRALADLVTAHGTPESSNVAQPTGWDEAAQLYLAIVALDSETQNIPRAEFNATRELLAFPEPYDSPRGLFGRHAAGTGSLDPPTANPRSRRQIVARLVKLMQQLERSRD